MLTPLTTNQTGNIIMKPSQNSFLITLVSFFALAFLSAGNPLMAQQTGEAAPEFTLMDSNGNEHSLSDFSGQVVVLEWLNHECPFVRKFYNAGEMQRMQEMYTEDGVVWLSVISSAPGKQGHMSPDEINAAVEEHGSEQTAVLIDEDGAVGRSYNARTTPHMFVIDTDGTLVYNGAMDDQPSANPATLEDAQNYVVLALNATLSGNDVETSSTRPYGCSVKY
jgi:peroxiredoxin